MNKTIYRNIMVLAKRAANYHGSNGAAIKVVSLYLNIDYNKASMLWCNYIEPRRAPINLYYYGRTFDISKGSRKVRIFGRWANIFNY